MEQRTSTPGARDGNNARGAARNANSLRRFGSVANPKRGAPARRFGGIRLRPSGELTDGTVYLIVDPYPSEGPELLISGEDASVAQNDTEIDSFVSRLVIGAYAGEINYVDHWYLVSLENHVAQARLSSLAAAVRCNSSNSEEWPERIYVHKGEGPIIYDLMDLDERTFLEINGSGIYARVEERYSGRPPVSRAEYEEMVDAVARNYGCHVLSVAYSDVDGTPIREEALRLSELVVSDDDDGDDEYDYYADLVHVIDIRLVPDDEDELAGRLIDCGRAVYDYLVAIRGGDLDAQKIMSVLRGGHAEVLVGMHESGHLEVKSSAYNINAPGQSGERQKIELAQDVARFANGDRDAILVLGYREQKSDRVSRINCLAPLNLANVDTAQYQSILDSKIVPPITGLVIEKVEVDRNDTSGIIFMYVPRQPEEMQPYLVHGAIVGDKVEGAFFSIVQRRGEGSITLSASQVHGYIVAGKAFLRNNS